MANSAKYLKKLWHRRIHRKLPQCQQKNQQSILKWLLGEDLERFKLMNELELARADRDMNCRLNILRNYLDIEQNQAYRHLLDRFGSAIVKDSFLRQLLRFHQLDSYITAESLLKTSKIVIQHSDYIRKQIAWIAQCSGNIELRNALLLTSLEEYCLRSLGNRTVLSHYLSEFLMSQKNDC